MNRESRRNLLKKGFPEETVDKLEMLSKPCTIGEAVQLARAAAEDTCADALALYKKDTGSLIMAMTLQIELLKSLVISHGIITEEEFNENYRISAEQFEKKQREYLESKVSANTEDSPKGTTVTGDMKVSDIEITKV